MDLLTDLADYLILNNFATEKSEDIFKNSLPPDPADVIALFEYSGRPPPYPIEIMDRSIQIDCRSADPDQTASKAWQIYKFLCPVEDSKYRRKVTLSEARWAIIRPKDTPHELYVDDNGRSIWICNYAFLTQGDG